MNPPFSDVQIVAFEKAKACADTSRIFLAYMTLMGDIEKTALALDLEPAFVDWIAMEERWDQKIRRISVMSKSEKPGDFERAQNRAMVFVQAVQMRQVIDGVLQYARGQSPENLSIEITKAGPRLSAKFICELTQAVEAAARVSFVALGDTVTERVEAMEDGHDRVSTNSMHAAIIAALSRPDLFPASSDVLVREQTAKVKQIADSIDATGDMNGPV